jgi:hypothetical protein
LRTSSARRRSSSRFLVSSRAFSHPLAAAGFVRG